MDLEIIVVSKISWPVCIFYEEDGFFKYICNMNLEEISYREDEKDQLVHGGIKNRNNRVLEV